MSTFGVTGTIAYLKYLQALKQNAVNQLSGVRNSKAYQIEAYYRIIHSYVLTLSEDRIFIDAIKHSARPTESRTQLPFQPEPWSLCVKII